MQVLQTTKTEHTFLSGGGKMGELIQSRDWSKTPLGNIDTWPQSLYTALSLILTSKFPMLIWWGDELIQFYNDAYLPSLHNTGRHPQALGQNLKECWPETWDALYPLIQKVQFGESVWNEDQKWSIYRNGHLEDSYWTYSYSPVRDNEGAIKGILVVCNETTKNVLSQRHLKQQLSNLFIQATLALAILRGEDHIIEVVNERMLELWGRSSAQVLNKPAFEAIPDANGQGFEELLNSVYTTGKRFVAEEIPVSLLRKGKMENIYVKVVYEALREEDGTISGIMALADEITDQVQTRKKIEESEEKFRIAIEGGGLGTYDFYPQTGELTWSEKTKELFGLPPEAEVDYSIYLKGLHPDDRERSDNAIQKAMDPKYGGLYENEYRAIGITDGKLRWIRSKAKVNFDADGRPIRFTGVTQDITKQKETLASLKVQSLVLERMDEGVSVSDEDGYIVFTNPAEDKMFGYAAGELIGKNVTIQNAYSPEENKRIVAEVIDQLKSQGFWSGEWHNRKKDGTYFYTSSYITSVSADGITRFVCVQRDITEEKKTREALIESELRFRTISNSIPQLAWMADADGAIFWYNDKWYEFTGTTPEEMIGWGWQSVHDPETLPAVLDRWKSSIESGEAFEMVFPLKGTDGKFRQFLTRVLPVFNSEGQIQQWFGTNTDITHQIESEQQLKKVKEQLELTFQNVPSAIYHFNKEGKIIYLNERGAKQIGYETVEAVLGEKDVSQLRKKIEETYLILNEKGFPMATEEGSVATCFRTRKSAEIVFQLIHRETGQSNWYISNSSPLFDENGELFMVLSTATDITLQKISEQVISQSEERFRTLAETLPQMIWIKNLEGQFEYGSKSWEDYSGIKDVSEACIAMTHPEDHEPIMNVWKTAVEERKPFKCEVRLKNKNGEYRWHSAAEEPVKGSSGEVVKYIGTLTDIHEQKRALDQKDEFISIASHELKTPVTSLKGFTQILQMKFEKEDNQQAADLLSKMDKQVDKLTNLIVDLLDATKIENGKIIFAKEDFDVNHLVTEIAEEMQRTTESHKLTMNLAATKMIHGDKNRIGQVITNLISNAIKYSPTADEVIISTTDENNKIKFSIQDFGIGIPQEKQSKVFDRFFRVSGNNGETYPGLGLGLFISSEIIKRHKGKITLESAEDKGSTFSFTLPAIK